MLIGNMCNVDSNCIFNNPYKNNIDMTQYIPKSALVAEIENCINRCNIKKQSCPVNTQVEAICDNKICAYKELLSFINTLEVKEVNLEKELDEWMRYGPHTSYPWCTIPDAVKITAEHFYELGLKAKKGE